MTRHAFGPLTPEMLAADRARRAAAEPEIARKEAALNEAMSALSASEEHNVALEAELEEARRTADDAQD